MVFDFIEDGRAVSLEREVFPKIVGRGLTPYQYDGYWSEAGTLPSYLHSQRVLLDAGRAKISSDADVSAGSLRPPVYVAPGSFVEGRLGPHVVLGKSCQVGRASATNAALLAALPWPDKPATPAPTLGTGPALRYA